MSYNISTFKLKELYNFRIPLASLYKHRREDWHPDRRNNDDGSVLFFIYGAVIRGTIEGDTVIVNHIDCSGEGSGTAMNWILEPAFMDSSGTLIASCVWEGGDSIERITVKDGVIERQDIDI